MELNAEKIKIYQVTLQYNGLMENIFIKEKVQLSVDFISPSEKPMFLKKL